MNPAPCQNPTEKVWRYLQDKAVGRDNAIPSRALARALRMPERTVRASVHQLRCSGFAIGSAVEPPFGFYLPRDREEADLCSRQLWSRVSEIARVARAFDFAARGLGLRRGQVEQIKMVFGEEV